MGAYFRIAPGVRLRARGSGLAVGIGPRELRLWLGSGGQLGVSTGVGPFTFYRSLGRVAGPGGTTSATMAVRAEEARRAAADVGAMLSVHRQAFPPARPPQAPPPEPVDVRAIERRHRRELLRGIGLFRFSARREAKARARALAEEEAARERARREAARAELQRELDRLWERLCANDPPVVLATLEEAFRDNRAPAVAVDCEGGRATVVLLMEGLEAVPERAPSVTPTGRPTTRRLTKTERNELYLGWMSSNVLATVREALAVAPGLAAVTVAVLRRDGLSPFGELVLSPVYVGTFGRAMCERIAWDRPEALGAIFHAEGASISLKGRTKELAPLDPRDHPGLEEVIAEVRRASQGSPDGAEGNRG